MVFNDAATDVRQITPSERFALFGERNGVTHQVEITGSGSALTRTFRTNRQPESEQAGQAWLSQALPNIVCESGLNVPGRVAMLYTRGEGSVRLVFANVEAAGNRESAPHCK